MIEKEKPYGTLKLPKTDVSRFVKVDFEVVSEKDFRNYAKLMRDMTQTVFISSKLWFILFQFIFSL